jgi:diguanylate cyclase (GGDEF)-like protein
MINYLIRPEFSFSIFYLLPVALVTWFVGKQAGILIAITGAVAWLVNDLTSRGTYSNPAIPYWNVIVRLVFFLIVIHIMSALKREREAARTDPLTGAANGRAFFELTNNEINRLRRYQHPFTVAYMDIDNFKTVNDRFGHSMGDHLLNLIAGIIQKSIRATDTVSRLGGDEFAILLPETGHEPAQLVIRKVQKSLSDNMMKNGWPITFSIGVLTWVQPPVSVDEIIKAADVLMYSAKSSGKNMIKSEVANVGETTVSDRPVVS